MPKYTPTEEDLYNTNPCPICGNYILEFNTETCSEDCEYEWKSYWEDYHKDFEDFLYNLDIINMMD